MDNTTLEDSSVKLGFAGVALVAARGLVGSVFGWHSNREQRLRGLEASREEERAKLIALQDRWAAERLSWDEERLQLQLQVGELSHKLDSAFERVESLKLECQKLQAAIKAASRTKAKPRPKPKPKSLSPCESPAT